MTEVSSKRVSTFGTTMDHEPSLLPQYQKMLDNGEYESIEELCNQEGLNYDDVFEDNREKEKEEDFI